MKDFIDDDAFEIGVRKHSEDKLTYKLIIANGINECRRTEGLKRDYPNSVMALVNLLSFDIKGYNLKTQIDKRIDQLDKKKIDIYTDKEENIPRWKFFKNSYQSKFRDRLNRWYWETLFQRILQILALEGLLFDTEKIISVKSIGEETTE